MKTTLRYYWRCVRNFVRFCWRYGAIMAADNDYDYAPLVRLMAEKLHNMANLFESAPAGTEGAERKAGEMRACAILLEAVVDDDAAESDLTEALAIMNGGLLDWWD